MSGADEVDPRRAFWRRGSYEIVGDWIRPASLSVLDRLVEATGRPLEGARLLDLATGTGAVAIEAARGGATVVGVDLTDELVEVARHRASSAGVDGQFVVGDFDRLDNALSGTPFAEGQVEVMTSAFGLIFAPDPAATLAHLEPRLADDGAIAVAGWDPDGVFVVPESLLELLPERPRMPDMGAWTSGAATLCERTPFEVVSLTTDQLLIPFASVADAAEQLERWSGGWAQLFDGFDALAVGDDARQRFADHLAAFSTSTDDGIELRATYHVSVLRRTNPGVDGG
ncbi:MAG: class I SAM-dependent methyltransferase [Actinomycetota bacterium]